MEKDFPKTYIYIGKEIPKLKKFGNWIFETFVRHRCSSFDKNSTSHFYSSLTPKKLAPKWSMTCLNQLISTLACDDPKGPKSLAIQVYLVNAEWLWCHRYIEFQLYRPKIREVFQNRNQEPSIKTLPYCLCLHDQKELELTYKIFNSKTLKYTYPKFFLETLVYQNFSTVQNPLSQFYRPKYLPLPCLACWSKRFSAFEYAATFMNKIKFAIRFDRA